MHSLFGEMMSPSIATQRMKSDHRCVNEGVEKRGEGREEGMLS
jgi:hypothetical protein